MTTAALDIFVGDSKTPSAWYEIWHDGFDADEGFGGWLRQTLAGKGRPPSAR